MKKVSVIIPCYNVEKYIERCLNSIINQTYSNLEILCIDDGSKDNTKKIIKKFLEKDTRIKYFYKENGGLSSARNYGLKYINGFYCCFIDSDDYVDSTYVSKLVNSIEKNNSEMAVCEFDRVYGKHITHKEMKMKDIENFIVPAAWNKMFISDYFKDLSFPEGLWYEDLGTIPKLYLLTDKIKFIDEYIYYYRQQENSIMHTFNEKIFNIYPILENLKDYYDKNDIKKEYTNELEKIFIYNTFFIINTLGRVKFKQKLRYQNDSIKFLNKSYPNWYRNTYLKNEKFKTRLHILIMKYNFLLSIYNLIRGII